MTHTINSASTVAVATDYFWQPIDTNTPRGVKLQLLGKGGLKGGKKRMESLTPEQRSELGKQAREARRAKEALALVEASAKANQLNKVN